MRLLPLLLKTLRFDDTALQLYNCAIWGIDIFFFLLQTHLNLRLWNFTHVSFKPCVISSFNLICSRLLKSEHRKDHYLQLREKSRLHPVINWNKFKQTRVNEKERNPSLIAFPVTFTV